MVLSLYVIDTTMVAAALGSAVSAAGEIRRQPIPRWRLLMPGAFALIATILMLAYPQTSDLLDAQFLFILLIAALVGGVRGAFIGMASDHYWRLVRLDNGLDSVLAAIGMLAVGILQFAIEASTGAENRAETTFEFVMGVLAGYLIGRSVGAWFHARALHHHDLKEV